MQNLVKLHLDSNTLNALPEGISHLKSLQYLDLGENKIEAIPEGLLQSCPQLKLLELKANPIKSIHPDAFIHLPNLVKLVISEAMEVTQFPNLNGTSSLELIRFDRSKVNHVPQQICLHSPNIKSLELKSNQLQVIPDLTGCQNLRVLDLSWNKINAFDNQFKDLKMVHDILLSHNNLSQVGKEDFKGLFNLQTLDLSNNKITEINEDAFADCTNLRDINLGVNNFPKFPTKGLKNLIEIKTHNNPALTEFPTAKELPNVQSLVMSYAYHCCQFMPSTFQHFIPEYEEYDTLTEEIYLPGDYGLDAWNNSDIIWTASNDTSKDFWDNVMINNVPGHGIATPRPGIQCLPSPGPFLPCNDLFDWWTLRCSVWIVFLLALLGNGCVVIVLIASRGKMDVPRFLVCNLAMADFCMGLYLGFLAVVDAATLGDFRKFAIHWQFSAGCQAAGFLGVLSSELSVFTLAVITLERNYAITHAMHLNKRLSLKHAAYIMCCGWTFALIMATMPLIGISDYRKFAVCLPFETGDPLSLGFVIFLMLINGVAFSILMGCYLKMYCAIRGSQAWNSNDSRIAKRMALLVFTDFICWAPIAFFALTAAGGLHLINLEQAKVFTIFILPLNSCCNPFLYAILTKQFKKDCVMICKAIEESRVTRGIGRCRHSSNFSNRQTPANTNSLNSGSGSHGSHSKGTVCSCNAAGKKPSIFSSKWPFNKLKHFFMGVKDSQLMDVNPRGQLMTASEYANQIAEIQKQQKNKRHTSMSSDNFSSSRSDSWRHQHQFLINPASRHHHHHHHRRRNSWTVTRKPSQDSQMSSSRNDSASSNSTNTFRMSRSSMSSNDHSMARTGSNYSSKSSGVSGAARAYNLQRMATENSAAANMLNKPKLMRQAAILADGDSTASGKSVTFKEPPGIGSTRRFVAAAADVGTCPLHSHERYKLLYDKLVETAKAQAAIVTPEEESDMEASDVEDEVPNVNSDSLPLGTTFRTIHLVQPQQAPPQAEEACSLPRKLSTISSADRESIPNIDEDEQAQKTTEAEVHAKLLNTTDFDWHPDQDQEDKDPESEALLSKEPQSSEDKDSPAKPSTSRYKNTHV